MTIRNCAIWPNALPICAYLSSGTKDIIAASMTIEPLASFDPTGKVVARLAAEVPSIENGGTWVKPMLERLDRAWGQMPHAFKSHPRGQFEKHVWVAPFYEDNLSELKTFVPAERMLFGSDFPHPEGLANPLDYLEEFDEFTSDEVEKIFSTNLKGLLAGAAI